MDAISQKLCHASALLPVNPQKCRAFWKPGALALALALLGAFIIPLAFAETGSPSAETPLRVGCMQAVASNLNRDDALASIRVLGKIVAERRNLTFRIVPSIYETAQDFQQSLEKGEADLVVMTCADYLKLE